MSNLSKSIIFTSLVAVTSGAEKLSAAKLMESAKQFTKLKADGTLAECEEDQSLCQPLGSVRDFMHQVLDRRPTKIEPDGIETQLTQFGHREKYHKKEVLIGSDYNGNTAWPEHVVNENIELGTETHGGKFQSGAVAIVGLSYSEARQIYNDMKNLHAEKQIYKRSSTHNDMKFGYDLGDEPHRPELQNETMMNRVLRGERSLSSNYFRHVLLALPRPYSEEKIKQTFHNKMDGAFTVWEKADMREFEMNHGETSCESDPHNRLVNCGISPDTWDAKMKNDEDVSFEYYFPADKYGGETDYKFMVRLKPETFGTGAGGFFGHAGSFVHTRIWSGYRMADTWYGDGKWSSKISKSSKSGMFTLDVGRNMMMPFFEWFELVTGIGGVPATYQNITTRRGLKTYVREIKNEGYFKASEQICSGLHESE